MDKIDLFSLPHVPERYFISPKAQSQRRSQQHCGTHIVDHHKLNIYAIATSEQKPKWSLSIGKRMEALFAEKFRAVFTS